MDRQQTSGFSPLLGDDKGQYRVHILGNSGSGKSTLGRELASILGVPLISLDTIRWQPGWKSTEPEEFRPKIQLAMAQCERGWVVEGDYARRGGNLPYNASTDVIWLDPPLLLYFPRVIIRTFLRLIGLEEPCSPGCSERLSEVFLSKQSIIWWCISHHWDNRRLNMGRMTEIGLGIGKDVDRRRMRRIGGWGGELKTWLNRVRDMVQAQKKD